jgi:SAM-dependent methyltransferase
MPSDACLQAAYEDYYTHEPRVTLPRRTIVARTLAYGVLGLFREYHALERLLVSPGRGKLLEVGFGSGARLGLFRDMGWDVHGQEVDRVCVRQARRAGFCAHEGPLVDLRLPDAEFDMIVGSHVIEHIRDSVEFVVECRRLLRPGGRLVLRTPNSSSYCHDVFGASWRGLEPPRHVYLYNRSSMERLLRKCGFRSFTVWTSAARCIGMIRESLALRSVRRGACGQVTAARHVLAARIRFQIDPDSGDELVVDATRA